MKKLVLRCFVLENGRWEAQQRIMCSALGWGGGLVVSWVYTKHNVLCFIHAN